MLHVSTLLLSVSSLRLMYLNLLIESTTHQLNLHKGANLYYSSPLLLTVVVFLELPRIITTTLHTLFAVLQLFHFTYLKVRTWVIRFLTKSPPFQFGNCVKLRKSYRHGHICMFPDRESFTPMYTFKQCPAIHYYSITQYGILVVPGNPAFASYPYILSECLSSLKCLAPS